ncbi:MAG: ATP-binding protein [Vicinamibacterales bacterium]
MSDRTPALHSRPRPPASPSITDTVLNRLIADDAGDAAWADLALAACDGPDALAAALDGTPPPRRAREGTAGTGERPEPPGAYLRSITVEGFRGIGAAATLTLAPGPGLTLVVGRNGSGKSSFAEGLEMLLTDRNRRWDGRTSVWKEGWRCLHQPDPCSVRAEFAVEALGTVTVERRWSDDAPLDGSVAWCQATGAPRRPYEELGWNSIIRTHRPLLPYSELGTVFDKPSEIHDALVEVLGLGEFDAVQKTLQAARKAREAVVSDSTERLKALRSRLTELSETSDDQRAIAAARALTGKKADLAALRLALDENAGASADDGVAALRQAMLHGQPPSREAVATASREVRAAAGEVSAAQGSDAGRARDLARLLGDALRFHAAHTGDDCPVCGTPGVLGTTWREQAESALQRLTSEADAAERAHRRLDRAMAAARDLLRVPLRPVQAIAAMGLSSSDAAVEALTDGGAGRRSLIRCCWLPISTRESTRCAPLSKNSARKIAAELTRREDLWRPVASDLRDWLPRAQAAETTSSQVALLKKAETWFKGVQADLRASASAP